MTALSGAILITGYNAMRPVAVIGIGKTPFGAFAGLNSSRHFFIVRNRRFLPAGKRTRYWLAVLDKSRRAMGKSSLPRISISPDRACVHSSIRPPSRARCPRSASAIPSPAWPASEQVAESPLRAGPAHLVCASVW